MKKWITLLLTLTFCVMLAVQSSAANVYTVVKGDSLWKIAVKYQVGLSELCQENPSIQNPALIYPGEQISIPQKDTQAEAMCAEVIRLVNDIRSRYGLGKLTENWELSRVALYKSQDMSTLHYFSHTSPTYGSPFQMMQNFGIRYRYAGENLAYGQRTAQAVVDAWMNSPGHRANILNANYTQIGMGYVADGRYWTQMMIG